MLVLPSAPTDKEKLLYLRQNKYVLYSVAFISLLFLTYGSVLFCSNSVWLSPIFVYTLVTAIYLIISYLIGVFSTSFDIKKHRYITTKWTQEEGIAVDIYLPNCGEPFEVIQNTVEHVKRMKWAGVLNIYMLDEKNRPELKALCDNQQIHYVVRNYPGFMKKAGNLRNAYRLTKGDFFAVFDADFCPREDFLQELMPYFFWDGDIAIVQSPQFFRILPQQTWVEKGAGYVQEFFYRLVQVNRDHWNAPICVGTNAIYRRESLLAFGGTAPVGFSEDMPTGFSITETGWKVKYVPINLATGICPDTVTSFFFQQYRWCMGSTGLFFDKHFWRTRLKFTQRLSYLSGMLYYITTSLGIIIAPLPSIISVWFFHKEIAWINFLYIIPSFLFINLWMPLWTKAPYGFYAPSMRLVSYYAHASALLNRITSTEVPWVATGVSSSAKAKLRPYVGFKRALTLWTTAQLIFVVGGSLYHSTSILDLKFFPNILLTLFNTYIACTIIFRD